MNNKLSILLILIIFVPGTLVAQYTHLNKWNPEFEFGILIEETDLINSTTISNYSINGLKQLKKPERKLSFILLVFI